MVAARCEYFQQREASQKVDLCLTIASVEGLDNFSNSQLTWTDAPNYEAALQKHSALCKHITSEQFFKKNMHPEMITELRGNSKLKTLSISGGGKNYLKKDFCKIHKLSFSNQTKETTQDRY